MSLTVFEFQDYPVRFVGTPERPEWIAKDVCHCLGLDNTKKALSELEEYDAGVITISDNTNRSQKYLTIYETGLYALIFKSRKPEAKAFKRWVIEEVLPSIRKTGSYSTNYQNLDIQALELEVKRKKLILENIKLDQKISSLKKSDQNLPLLKIRNLLQKKGELTIREVKRYLRWEKSMEDTIKDCFKSLVDKGLAKDSSSSRTQKIKLI